MSYTDRFNMRAHPRWRPVVEAAAKRRRVSLSRYVEESSWAVAEGEVIPAKRLHAALAELETVADELRGFEDRTLTALAGDIEDAMHLLRAAEEGERPGDSL